MTGAQYEEEVSLAEYLLVLWRYRLVLLLVVVAAVVLVVIIDMNRPSLYQASSRLMVAPSRPGDMVPGPSLGTLQAMVTSPGLVAEVIEAVGLARSPHALTPDEAISRMSVRPVPDTSLLEITARVGDPELAAQFANGLAEAAAALATRTTQEDAVAVRDSIKQQLDDLRLRFNEADATLASFRRGTTIEAIEADVQAMMRERGRLLPLLVAIEGERARAQKITEELAGMDSALERPSASIARTPKSDGRDSTALRLRDQAVDPFVNPVYESLQHQLAETRARLSALEKERAAISRETNVADASSNRVYQLHLKRSELERLDMERELAKRVYQDVSNRYEQALLQTSARPPQVQVMDRAVASSTRISPKPLRDAVAAGAAAFLVAAAAILLIAAVQRQIRQ